MGRKLNSVVKTIKNFKNFMVNTNVPLCHSDHYIRDHFHK